MRPCHVKSAYEQVTLSFLIHSSNTELDTEDYAFKLRFKTTHTVM